MAIYNHWTVLVDWAGGLNYWTQILLLSKALWELLV